MYWIIGGVVCLAIVAVVAIVLVRRRRSSSDVVSMVLLRRSRRNLTEADVRAAARRVLKKDADAMAAPSPDPGVTNGFAVLMNGTPFLIVIDAGRPYEDDPADTARSFEDPRCREAYSAHTAWVSVDFVGGMPPDEVRDVAIMAMARMAADLVDDDTTLIYSTWLGRVALPGPESDQALRSKEPLSAFGDAEVNTPIIHASSDDARINRAMEKARREWPTFTEVWGRRGTACEGMVKVRLVTGENTEYIWMSVTTLGADTVTGVFENEPIHTTAHRKGQSFTAPQADIVDWACVDGEKGLGLYVERVLRG
jgi:uncharacterized protein YegJ (DUF2314 family)